jgi:predicted TPR repeat methyltransferase
VTDDERFAAARAQFTAGLAALQAGEPVAAEQALRAALQLLPGRPSTQLNLAVALLQQSRPADALPLLDAVLAEAPDDVDALGHRGLALNQLHRPTDAGPCFERLVRLAPDRAEAWFHLGQTWQMVGRPAEAVEAYDRCLALRPVHAATWSQRGTALRELGHDDAAAASFERAQALQDDDGGLNAYYLAALHRGAAPATAPRAYVQRLFDDYAADFDQHLVDQLGYCAPEVLQRLLVGLGRDPFEHVLDLGCGTGLCGPQLRAMANQLTGVDLSAAMLAVAAQRGIYDRLVQAELAGHLADTTDRVDLVVAADVFIYIGDLTPVFNGVRRVLNHGGVFAFSVERASDDAAFVLQPSLRFAHGERSVRELAAEHGFQVLRVEQAALRVDETHAVQGQYWLLTG